MSVKTIESRAPPDPPADTTWSMPSVLSSVPMVSARMCDSDLP